MAEHALTKSTEGSSHLGDAGHAMENTMQSMREGASGALPAIANMVSRLVYTTSYAVSYGVVFPVMLVVRVVPKDNALVQGLVDGAQAAREQADGWRNGESESGLDELSEGEETEQADGDSDGAGMSKGHRRKGGRRGRKNSSHGRRG